MKIQVLPWLSQHAWFNVDNREELHVRSDGAKVYSKLCSDRVKTLKTNWDVRIVAPTVKEFAAFGLAAIGEVEAVLTFFEGRILHVYTVVNDFDAAVRYKIYEREEAIIDEFEMFDFHFDIVFRRGRPLPDCITDPSLELTFKR